MFTFIDNTLAQDTPVEIIMGSQQDVTIKYGNICDRDYNPSLKGIEFMKFSNGKSIILAESGTFGKHLMVLAKYNEAECALAFGPGERHGLDSALVELKTRV